MDVDRWRRVEEVLDVALTQEPDRWNAVLDDKCRDDPDLRREVEAFLSGVGTAHGFLESLPAAAAAALLAETRETERDATAPIDRRVGAYQLVREIGRGGMSRVYLAERADGQFEQRVALKVLRSDLDSDLDLERFRAERQILASLNHPNIARLLDGGVSDDGLPYLVMEYVEGEPLDAYCATRQLTVRQRLDVFLTVVEATQYAHRNLVVHRDLKPSNILVATDGVVKLLDFGLAKLLGPVYPTVAVPTTLAGHRWMTPEYAAPEQIRGESVTTLTDVYQLGTVLYELLAGRLPFGRRVVSAHEFERAVLERDAEPLGGVLGGDLDAIVSKAMRKSPDARYASVQELGDDIRRHLSGHPVLARRQTSGYLVRRFVRRHRVGLAASATLGLLLATYIGTVVADRARIARALAEATSGTRKAEQTTDFMLGLFEAAEGGKSLTDTVTARELLSRGVTQARELSAQPDLQAQMFDVIGRLHMQLGDYAQARPLLQEALAIRRRLYGDFHPDVATTVEHLADVTEAEQDLPGTVKMRREALAVRRRVSGDDDRRTTDAVFALALALHQADQRDEAGRLFDQWLAATARQRTDDPAHRADQLAAMASILEERHESARADSLYRESLRIRTAIFGRTHHVVAATLVDLATVRMFDGNPKEADSLILEAVSIFRSVYPEGHPQLANALRYHGAMLLRLGQFAQASEALREARAMTLRYLGPDALTVANIDVDLSYALTRSERYADAEYFANEALADFRRMFDDHNAMVYMARIFVGEALRGQRRFAEAEPLLLAAYARFARPNLVTRAWRNDALAGLVRLYDAENKPAEAARYRAILAEPIALPSPTAKPALLPPAAR